VSQIAISEIRSGEKMLKEKQNINLSPSFHCLRATIGGVLEYIKQIFKHSQEGGIQRIPVVIKRYFVKSNAIKRNRTAIVMHL
jgi:hypothetical protein